jgi:general secretion pathway protein A
MYEKFYGFIDKPFNLTPDSKFFYASAKHEEALNCLLLAISERNGFVVITGEIGSGKTTVCRTLLKRLDPSTKVALILNTHLGKKELLTTILEDLEIEYKSRSKTHLLSALNKYLIEQTANDVNVVLIIDEAQNLTPSVIEEVRMLSNLETEEEKLVQIILMGQPELRKKLAHPRLEQFRQRVVFHYHLVPLSYEETKEYIRYRLIKASASNGEVEIFTQAAIEEIYKYSKGVPRLINLVCHNALLSGLVYQTKEISSDIVIEAITELDSGLGHTFCSKTHSPQQPLQVHSSSQPKYQYQNGRIVQWVRLPRH